MRSLLHADDAKDFDDGKKLVHRKCDTVWTTPRLVVLHSAGIQNYEGERLVVDQIKITDRRLKSVFSNGVYIKVRVEDGPANTCGLNVQPIRRSVSKIDREDLV